MSSSTMQDTHVTGGSAPARPWLWTLAPRSAGRIDAAPHGRWLLVECGRVWLTRSDSALQPGEDVWLAAGDRQWLPAGSDWVAEGWPEARWALMEAPHGAAAPRRTPSLAAWLQALQRRLSGAALPA